jgi:hypothetical protein
VIEIPGNWFFSQHVQVPLTNNRTNKLSRFNKEGGGRREEGGGRREEGDWGGERRGRGRGKGGKAEKQGERNWRGRTKELEKAREEEGGVDDPNKKKNYTRARVTPEPHPPPSEV